MDPACELRVDPATATASIEYHGDPYYFCSAPCKAGFDGGPEVYARPCGAPSSRAAAGRPDRGLRRAPDVRGDDRRDVFYDV